MTNILDAPIGPNDVNAATIGEYLAELLVTVWEEEEGFSGKRPFGNSGWTAVIYQALLREGLVDGRIDEDGYLEYTGQGERQKADKLIADAVRAVLGNKR